MQHWCALYTKPRMERQVSSVLTGRGVETYLPLIYKYSKHRRRQEPSPFFPCYLFARVDPTSADFLSLRWTPGLRSIVRFGGKVARVPDEVVTRIKERLAQLEQVGYPKSSRFKHGERVRIEAGPLEGLEAMFDRTVSATGRVRILLDILGRLTACEIESDWLEKVR
ncbi:MAG: transcription termination/antitermination protein NusG [Anaerolineae bacterium]